MDIKTVVEFNFWSEESNWAYGTSSSNDFSTNKKCSVRLKKLLRNISWHWNVQEMENLKFLMVNLQDRAWHLQWMLINIESLTHQARWHVLIDFFITGGITRCCVIMALLHTSSWKPSSYTVSSLMPNKKIESYTFVTVTLHDTLLQWFWKFNGTIIPYLSVAPHLKLYLHTSTI